MSTEVKDKTVVINRDVVCRPLKKMLMRVIIRGSVGVLVNGKVASGKNLSND
jgi:hypothetical protein